MKIVSLFFMVIAGLSLLITMVLGIFDWVFPLGKIPAHSFLQLTIVCLLFSIALSIFKNNSNHTI
ncbi:MAG: hypothetical protein V1871_06400 [Planctomycetota bacterium]